MLRKLVFWSTAIFFSLVSAVSLADMTILDGLGASKTLKNFVCETTKLCSSTVIIKSDGTEAGTTSAPFQVGAPASAFADGWDATVGAKADSACGSDTGTCSQLALIKRLLQSVTTLNSNVSAAIPAGTNLIGDVNLRQGGTALSATNPIFSQPVSGAAGGATPTGGIAANSNNSTSIKGSAGTVYGIQTGNINSTTAYWLKLYDKATAPTCGTDTPVVRILIPPSNSGNNGTFPVGKAFTLGIGMCIVQGIADNDNTSVPAATIAWNVDYK